MLVVPASLQFVVITPLPLNTVAHVSGRQDEANDQHHGIELKALEPDKSEAPDCRERTGHQRGPPGATASKERVENKDHDAVGDEEDRDQYGQIVIPIAANHRLAGGKDVGIS